MKRQISVLILLTVAFFTGFFCLASFFASFFVALPISYADTQDSSKSKSTNVEITVPSVISLSVNSKSITIKSPIIGSDNNVKVSDNDLEAEVSTTNVNGAMLFIKGSDNTANPSALTHNTNPIEFIAPITQRTKFLPNPNRSTWGYWTKMAGTINSNNIPKPSKPDIDGLNAVYWTGVTDNDKPVSEEGSLTDNAQWNAPVDMSKSNAPKAYFYFAQQITANTKSGVYSGKITLSAIAKI